MNWLNSTLFDQIAAFVIMGKRPKRVMVSENRIHIYFENRIHIYFENMSCSYTKEDFHRIYTEIVGEKRGGVFVSHGRRCGKSLSYEHMVDEMKKHCVINLPYPDDEIGRIEALEEAIVLSRGSMGMVMLGSIEHNPSKVINELAFEIKCRDVDIADNLLHAISNDYINKKDRFHNKNFFRGRSK